MGNNSGLIISNSKRYPVIGRDGLHYFDNELDANLYLIEMQSESDLEFAKFWEKSQRKDDLRHLLFLVSMILLFGSILCWMIFK